MTWEQFKRHVRNLGHGRHNVQEHDWDGDSSVRVLDETPPGTSPAKAGHKVKRRKR
jgi:hypothetical protein